MNDRKPYHTVSEKIRMRAPVYQFSRYDVYRHDDTATIYLYGEHRKQQHDERIIVKVLPGETDAEIVRSAVAKSPNRWTISYSLNTSLFRGKFTAKLDKRLEATLIDDVSVATSTGNHPFQQPMFTAPSVPSAPPPPQQQFQWASQQPGQFFVPPVSPQRPGQSSSRLLLLLSGIYVLFWILCFVGEASSPHDEFNFLFDLGMSLFFGVATCICIIDWRGAITLQGLMHWQKRGWLGRIGFGFLCLVFSPFLTAVYLLRTLALPHGIPQQTPTQAPSPVRFGKPSLGLTAGSIVVLVTFLVLTVGNAANANTSRSVSTITHRPVGTTVTSTPPTQIASHAMSSPIATKAPDPTPRPTMQPTPIAPKPTPTPIPPKPTPTPCPGINCNPWGYNFSSPGKLIYYPPAGFCTYFACIPTFIEPDDPGDGYVVQCSDGLFSQSGGERGACSYHGGVSRPLYSH